MNKDLKNIVNELSIEVCNRIGVNLLEKDINGHKRLDIVSKEVVKKMFTPVNKKYKPSPLMFN